VTYREEYLLYNEEIATTRQRENIITIIAHEYAVSLPLLINISFVSYLSFNSKASMVRKSHRSKMVELFVVSLVKSLYRLPQSNR
jgi:hypothetical protein